MQRLRRPRGRLRHPDILTPAEWAVVELARDGMTNAEIAVRRGVGPETVKSRVASILSKLSLPDRRALAAWDGQPGAAPAAVTAAGA
jgi:DNA-binding NarL/FixJ family response regulator